MINIKIQIIIAQVCKDFAHLAERQWSELEMACFGHDLIEDTRVSYNDVKEVLGEYIADIVYAVSNEKGKNRKERANNKYYNSIVKTEGAVFVKLCDRITNVQYSKMTGSKMYEMYQKENKDFLDNLQLIVEGYEYTPMVNYLNSLF